MHVEIPRDLLSVAAGEVPFVRFNPIVRPAPDPAGVGEAARVMAGAARPLILADGGARTAAGEVRALAGRLGAPVVMTTNGRGILPPGHPLAVPASPSLGAVRELIGEADAVLALGPEIGTTDYDFDDHGPLRLPGRLVRIDIDSEQLRRGAVPEPGLVGDARAGAAALDAALGEGAPAADGPARANAAREAAIAGIAAQYGRTLRFLETIRDTLPEAPLVGDSTHAVYAGNLAYAAPAPGLWFNAATGYGALGYGLQFSLAEFGTAVEERLPVMVLVWNNRGYGEIRAHMEGRQITPVGVDLHTPDFVAVARGYGLEATRMERFDALPEALRAAAGRDGPTLIEFDESVVLGA